MHFDDLIDMNPVRFPKLILIPFVAYILVACQPLFANSCAQFFEGSHVTVNLQTYPNLKNDILSLRDEMVAIAARERHTLDQNICRGASGTMQALIKARFGIETEAVANNFHTFLMVRNYYGLNQHLYIDSTYQQFVRPSLRTADKLFVGTELELKVKLIMMEVEDLFWNSYFDLRADSHLPSWF